MRAPTCPAAAPDRPKRFHATEAVAVTGPLGIARFQVARNLPSSH